MRAVGYRKPQPISAAEALVDVTLPDPMAQGHDLLVQVKAVSVNPVDTKVRASAAAPPGQDYKILGWDAVGIVQAVGPEVTLFKAGDRVWYAGSIARAGSNSELHLVDERIVGHAPTTLDDAQAAALPLTTITAWEMLFDRLGIAPGKQPLGKSLLIIGASGGVGSILVQLASRLTGLNIIGTASRPETQAWVKELGAHQDQRAADAPLALDRVQRLPAAFGHPAIIFDRQAAVPADVAQVRGDGGQAPAAAGDLDHHLRRTAHRGHDAAADGPGPEGDRQPRRLGSHDAVAGVEQALAPLNEHPVERGVGGHGVLLR